MGTVYLELEMQLAAVKVNQDVEVVVMLGHWVTVVKPLKLDRSMSLIMFH
jgi:hypothetical protein